VSNKSIPIIDYVSNLPTVKLQPTTIPITKLSSLQPTLRILATNTQNLIVQGVFFYISFEFFKKKFFLFSQKIIINFIYEDHSSSITIKPQTSPSYSYSSTSPIFDYILTTLSTTTRPITKLNNLQPRTNSLFAEGIFSFLKKQLLVVKNFFRIKIPHNIFDIIIIFYF